MSIEEIYDEIFDDEYWKKEHKEKVCHLAEKILEQRQETASAVDTIVSLPMWETPEEFGIYKIFEDGSFEYVEGELFWGLIEVINNEKDIIRNEIYLCGINEGGLYAYDVENDVDYYPGWSLEDIKLCMKYEQKAN